MKKFSKLLIQKSSKIEILISLSVKSLIFPLTGKTCTKYIVSRRGGKMRTNLTRKGISFFENNGELITKCLFNGCDDDSRTNETHPYFNPETKENLL